MFNDNERRISPEKVIITLRVAQNKRDIVRQGIVSLKIINIKFRA